jgi:Tubulin like
MSLYAIGIGGTGAKCLEALTQVSAIGLLTEQPLKILFVDADETNGNLERARTSLSIYQRCHHLMLGDKQQCAWLKTPINSYGLWSPFGHASVNKNLGSFFHYNSLKQNNPTLSHLFDVLYTQEEREANLDVGFRGRPAIGSAVMSRVDLDSLAEVPWSNLVEQVKADVGSGKSPKILLYGSIFGGTGASGLPTLGRLIANKLEKEKVRERVKIACLFVLPYFGFAPKPGEDTNGVYARSEQFLLNTEAALRYYVNQAQQFDTVYLLGNQNLSQYEFSIGKNTQRNEPHFIELYAALAARHFLRETPDGRGTVVLNCRQNPNRLVWSDLPDLDAVRSGLVNAARFAYVWQSNIAPDLKTAKDRGIEHIQRGAPWFVKFFRPCQGVIGSMLVGGKELPDFNNPEEQKAIGVIDAWCKDYLRWLGDLHQCDGDSVELFDDRIFKELDGQLGGEELPDLVFADSRDKNARTQDTVQRLREKLDPKELTPPNQGIAGLAKALYRLCKL